MDVLIFVDIGSKFAELAIWTECVNKAEEDLSVVLFATFSNSWKWEQLLGIKIINKKPQMQGLEQPTRGLMSMDAE